MAVRASKSRRARRFASHFQVEILALLTAARPYITKSIFFVFQTTYEQLIKKSLHLLSFTNMSVALNLHLIDSKLGAATSAKF